MPDPKDGTKQLLTSAMPNVSSMINLIGFIVLWIFDCIAVNVFTLIRSHFGERFMTFVNWLIGAWMFSLLYFFAALGGIPDTKYLRGLWGPAVFLCFLYHRWVIRKKNRAGVVWHSRFDGIPHLMRIRLVREFIPAEAIVKWIEPALLLAVAWLVRPLDRGFSNYLAFVGVALSIRAQVYYYFQRQRYLDERDLRIEQQYLGAALAGRPPEETAGFTIAESNRSLIEQEAAAVQGKERTASGGAPFPVAPPPMPT